jgi:hypothetical protein
MAFGDEHHARFPIGFHHALSKGFLKGFIEGFLRPAELREYAERRGWQIADVYTDAGGNRSLAEALVTFRFLRNRF